MTAAESIEARLRIRQDEIERFSRLHGIRRLAFLGSVLTPEFDQSSDVDVLGEFRPGRAPGLLGFAQMEIELPEILGRKVDLSTPGFLHPRFRDRVLASAVVYFEAA